MCKEIFRGTFQPAALSKMNITKHIPGKQKIREHWLMELGNLETIQNKEDFPTNLYSQYSGQAQRALA